MRIETKKRRLPVIPIIPLMDILVILLIFFMLTTTFPEKREYLPIELPRVTNLPTEQSAERRVTLEIAENGEMRLADSPIDIRGLSAALRKMKEQLPNAKVEIKADVQISLELLLQVWEALLENGIPVKEVPFRVEMKVP